MLDVSLQSLAAGSKTTIGHFMGKPAVVQKKIETCFQSQITVSYVKFNLRLKILQSTCSISNFCTQTPFYHKMVNMDMWQSVAGVPICFLLFLYSHDVAECEPCVLYTHPVLLTSDALSLL